MDTLPPFTAVVLAGGRAARLGGQVKPQLLVGGRPILAAVLGAVAAAERRVVVGPPQPVPADVVLLREQPPGGGPVAAIRAGLAEVGTDVVVVVAGDLPFLTADVVEGLRQRLTRDGVMAVDDTGRDQYLLGAWRTTALRTALTAARGPMPLRRVLAPIAAARWRPDLAPGDRPPWLDCDTPADLARARAMADGHLPPPPPAPPPVRPVARPSLVPRFQEPRGPD
ncbi:MAG: Molybdenum cofactor guanylyltransferase [uncultured Blastococcus sp.]|uniref:Molybdenum cofactor guanylyltransferase n=1 Tax=uncultured Blastococcus sp. TaxID=217144 RepID=A0A6J4H2T6_9ACTN|nr:MAG: Molybdenum cofactor guanylyltransferase [uncultured Blastococcus sp.]